MGPTKLIVANASCEPVECRVDSEKVRIKSNKRVEGYTEVEYQHDGDSDQTSTSIPPRTSVLFRVKGKPVYMTILTEWKTVCVNYEVWKKSNYIVSEEIYLLQAEKDNTWVDITGKEHAVEYARDEEDPNYEEEEDGEEEDEEEEEEEESEEEESNDEEEESDEEED